MDLTGISISDFTIFFVPAGFALALAKAVAVRAIAAWRCHRPPPPGPPAPPSN